MFAFVLRWPWGPAAWNSDMVPNALYSADCSLEFGTLLVKFGHFARWRISVSFCLISAPAQITCKFTCKVDMACHGLQILISWITIFTAFLRGVLLVGFDLQSTGEPFSLHFYMVS